MCLHVAQPQFVKKIVDETLFFFDQVAARFLLQKYQETGDWVQAAGAYHSSTDSHADRYMARFEDVLAGIGDIRLADAGPIVERARVNAFPLLVAGEGRASNGSLMPRVGGVGSLLRRMP